MAGTLRLIYPQWQGGLIDSWFPDLPKDDVSKGYYLGAQLLNFLCPGKGQSAVVPVTLESSDRPVENGISAKTQILRQTECALKILDVYQPDQILTIGGECAVSLPAFSYMLGKHKDAAIIWIDAHPDVHIPGDAYTGYHAMVLASCLGKGDSDFQKILPGTGSPQRTMLVGLRNLDNTGTRVKDWGINVQGTAHGRDFVEPVMKWLEGLKPSKVLIHFDLDELDPAEFRTAVGADPDGVFIKDVTELLQEINGKYSIGALTVAEFMPTWAIRIRNLFNGLPLHEL